MPEVVTFDEAASQRLLEQRAAVIDTLAEVGIVADEQTATAVLATVRDGVQVVDEYGRAVGLRPSDTADLADVLGGCGVAPTATVDLTAAATAVENTLSGEVE